MWVISTQHQTTLDYARTTTEDGDKINMNVSQQITAQPDTDGKIALTVIKMQNNGKAQGTSARACS
jgi:hypothetical protein